MRLYGLYLIISFENAKEKLNDYNRIGANLRFSGFCRIYQIGFVFVEFDLFNNFYTKLHIYEFSYKFDTVLYQFLETETSDRTLMGRSINS